MNLRWVAVFVLLVLTGSASADAAPCRTARDANDPMAFGSAFGNANCGPQRMPRYHFDDYDTEDASPSDPMVWSNDRWASDLFGGYDDVYDRRSHARSEQRTYVTRRVVSIEIETPEAAAPNHGFKTGVISGSHVDWTVHKTVPRATNAVPSGARVWSGGVVCTNCGGRAVIRPATRCAEGGSLVVTWTGHGADYRCSTPRNFHRWVR